MYPEPTASPIGGGGDVPQVPAEVAGRDEVVVCPEKRDEEEQREGTNEKEKANLKYWDETVDTQVCNELDNSKLGSTQHQKICWH